MAPDGVVRLRFCGAVHVAGKTVTETSQAIEKQLAQYFDSPQVGVEVIGYNSKSYHVIVSGALASREVVQRFPITGNETVLDAIGQIQGLSAVSSKTIWVARPAPPGREQILPVNWEAIARGGETATNYQLLPGDRVYIADDSLIALNGYIDRLVSPIEQLVTVSSLGGEHNSDCTDYGPQLQQHPAPARPIAAQRFKDRERAVFFAGMSPSSAVARRLPAGYCQRLC